VDVDALALLLNWINYEFKEHRLNINAAVGGGYLFG
jgi:hypothetical protein